LGTSTLILSNGSTCRVLWVICSIFDFSPFSPTSPIHHLTIHNILHKKSAISIASHNSGAIFGIRGAGGRVGHLNLICGMKLGRLIIERSGGLGITGTLGSEILICACPIHPNDGG